MGPAHCTQMPKVAPARGGRIFPGAHRALSFGDAFPGGCRLWCILSVRSTVLPTWRGVVRHLFGRRGAAGVCGP